MKRTLCIRAGLALVLFMLLALPALASGGGDDSDPAASKSASFKAGVTAIKAQDYRKAIEWMTRAIAEAPKDADAYNYLGYAHRKLGDYDNALKFYGRALELDPEHRGAHEYLGEAYLELHQPEEAKKHLAALDKICWLGCEEYRDLKKAVASYERAPK
jgi:tetratricopeptide (TPR) repeat protein